MTSASHSNYSFPSPISSEKNCTLSCFLPLTSIFPTFYHVFFKSITTRLRQLRTTKYISPTRVLYLHGLFHCTNPKTQKLLEMNTSILLLYGSMWWCNEIRWKWNELCNIIRANLHTFFSHQFIQKENIN